MNALDALVEPGVWPTLKRTLKNQKLEIQNFTSLYLISASRLKPQPIDINVKVVMIGDSRIYNLLYFLDEDFKMAYVNLFLSEGYRIIYVGNGASDFAPARQCRYVFATDTLLTRCRQTNLDCAPFTDFNQVVDALESLY